MGKIIHYPNLQTVLMVETILKKEKDITRTGLKKKLPKQIMHQTLNVIIKYLEDSGKVIDHKTGIIWTRNENPKFRKMVENSVDATELFRRLDAEHDKSVRTPKTHGKGAILKGRGNAARDTKSAKKPVRVVVASD